MRKSQQVRLEDELTILRIINECRELGDDASAWQRRLIEGLSRLTGSVVAAVGLLPLKPDGLEGLGELSKHMIDGGWSSHSVRDRWIAWASNPEQVALHPATTRFFAYPDLQLTKSRVELVSDDEWNRSEFVNEFLRADYFDEGLLSRTHIPNTHITYLITLMRETGAAPFDLATTRAIELLQTELSKYLGKSLWISTQPNRQGLSPRLLQVLDRMLQGDSERQAAIFLGLHPTTVHDYVKRLYRHFDVNSRAELLAYFLKRFAK